MKSTALGRAVRPRSQAIRASADVSALVCLAMVERGRAVSGFATNFRAGTQSLRARQPSTGAAAARLRCAARERRQTGRSRLALPPLARRSRVSPCRSPTRTTAPCAGSGARGVSGVPSGCAGWRSRAASPREGREARAGRVARAGRAARLEGLSRLSLRRCGRRRGSPVRTSDFASSLISFHIIAHARAPGPKIERKIPLSRTPRGRFSYTLAPFTPSDRPSVGRSAGEPLADQPIRRGESAP